MRFRIFIEVLAVAMAVAAAAMAFAPFTAVDGLADDAAAAARASAFGPQSMADAKSVVLILDERSVASQPLASTPRALMTPVWAALARKALDNGADGVALDFIVAFDGKDFAIGDDRPLKGLDATFLRLLLKDGRAGKFVIGRSRELLPARRFARVAGGKGMGFVDVALDGDGVARRIETSFDVTGGGVATTLAGAMLRDPQAGPLHITPPAPLTDLPSASVIDVLACQDAGALKRLFEGRAVFIGSGLPGEDRLRTPDRFMAKAAPPPPGEPCAFIPPNVAGRADAPGVFLHAAAVDAHRSGWGLTPAASWAVAIVAAIAAGLAATAGLSIPPALAALVVAAIGFVGFAGSAWAQEAGALFPAARPAAAALLGFGFGWAGRLLFLDRRARSLRASFGRYVAPELVERILAQDKLPELDGEQRHVAIMFADLSGFTALSEQVDGKTLTSVVNAYLSLIAAEVEKSGGYIDKFIGDAAMAIWNAPADLENHERAATLAAVAIRDVVAEAAERDKERGLPNFAIKVGVNSGPAIVGNVGAVNRLNYTAVGDTVNIAARMEGLPSVFLTPVVLGEACAKAAADDFAMLEFASIQVKGRQEPVAVFAPYDEADRAHFPAYEAALAAYRRRDFDDAATGWRALADVEWSGADLSAVMADFAEAAKDEPLDGPWSGAVVMRTK